MPDVAHADLDLLTTAIEQKLAEGWVKWPGGYPGEIELALIDAAFSIRAQYGKAATETTPSSGVLAVVDRWRKHRGEPANDLTAITAVDEAEFLAICGNRTQTSGRTKALAIQEASANLLSAGIRSAGDFEPHQAEAKKAYTKVHGLGSVTFSYLRMLLGLDDVKADTWVLRFVEEAVGCAVEPTEASKLMHEAATAFAEQQSTTMPTTPTDLDHAIWYAQSQRLAQ